MGFEEILCSDEYVLPEGYSVCSLLASCSNRLSELIGSEHTPEDLSLLTEKYEKLACALSVFRSQTSDNTRLAFTEGERLVIDFALLDDASC
jgi:hypothetical protein